MVVNFVALNVRVYTKTSFIVY